MGKSPLGSMVAFVFLTGASIAWGFNLDFLAHDPLRYFTEEDDSMFEGVVLQALDNNPDGQASTWENPKTGASGSVTPLETFVDPQKGVTCRRVEIVDQAKGMTQKETVVVCEDTGVGWKLLPRQ